MKKLFVASVLATAISANGADAADSRIAWNGLYAGAHAGSIRIHDKFSEVVGFVDSGSLSGSGGLIGGLIGYNWRNGNFVSGFEFDLGMTTASGYEESLDMRAGLNWVANGRARIGYVLDRTLFFAAGGISVAQVEQIAFGGVIGFKQDYFAYGLNIGAGFETFLQPNWLFRAEYIYTNYSRFDQVNLPFLQTQNEIDTHTARAALIYQFGGAQISPSRGGGQPNWDGAYIGAHYGHTKLRETHDTWLGGGALQVIGTADGRGFSGGVLAGVNFQRGPWVAGFEFDFGLGSISTYEDGNIVNLPFGSQLVWDAHIRARLGYAYGNYLLYVSGGMAVAQFRQSLVFNEFFTSIHVGHTYGLGLDTALAQNFIFRIEYLVSEYGVSSTNLGVDTDAKTETVRAAIIYKYDSASPLSLNAPRRTLNWGGGYAGIYGGWHELEQRFNFFAVIDEYKLKGFSGGFLAGFNRQEGNWVFGFELDGGLFDGKSVTRVSACLCDEVTIKGIWESHWRARIGYAMGHYLPFVSAGLAFGQFQQSPSLDSPQKRIHAGFTIGAGVDAMLSANWLFRLEYLMSQYDARIYNFISTGGDASETENRTHAVRAALIYRFEQ